VVPLTVPFRPLVGGLLVVTRRVAAAAALAIGFMCTRDAGATCIQLSDGTVHCSAPGGGGSTYRVESSEWLRKPGGAHLEASLVGGGWFVRPDDVGIAGGTLSFGLRWQQKFDAKGIDSEDVEEGSYCAPIACGVAFVGLMPASAWLGNELGFDVFGSSFLGSAGTGVDTRIGLRPHFRVVRKSRVRTASLVGALLPAVDVQLHGGRVAAFDFVWSPYPISVHLTSALALEIDPLRIGLSVPVTAERARPLVGSFLGLSVLL
jgi:hypothetical protein